MAGKVTQPVMWKGGGGGWGGHKGGKSSAPQLGILLEEWRGTEETFLPFQSFLSPPPFSFSPFFKNMLYGISEGEIR